MTYIDYSLITLIDTIDHRLRCLHKGYYIVAHEILNEKNKISKITIRTDKSTKENIKITIDDIKHYMKKNLNLIIIKNKNIKEDKIFGYTYKIEILTMNRYIEGK